MNKLVMYVATGLVLFGGAALAADQNDGHKRGGGGKGGGNHHSSRPAPQAHRGAPQARRQASPRRASPPAASFQHRSRKEAGTRRFDRPVARPRAAERREHPAVQKRIKQHYAKEQEREAARRNTRKRAAEQENARKRAAEQENAHERKRAAERAAEHDGKAKAAKKADRPAVAEKRENRIADHHEELRRKRLGLSHDQRTSLRRAFNVGRGHIRHARFAHRVGTRLPHSVRLFWVPAAVYGIFPEYRSYRYVVIDDDICIVDPETYYVVDVIDEDYLVPPSSAPQVAELTLTQDERELVLDSIAADFPEADVTLRLALGADIPDRVELHGFAPIVLDRVAKLRDFRFIVAQGSVVIVDPRDRSIALVLER
jgi:Protein of unknown function (DUF1236)